MTPEQAKEIAGSMLSEQRFHHSMCVAECAAKLALRLGVDQDDALVAGYLHDMMKEQSDAVLLKWMEGSAIMQCDYLEQFHPLWHAYAGAAYAKYGLGLSQEIADAIRYHTSGKKDMSPLEKCIFLADYISEDRTFPGSSEVRGIAERDIDEACLTALKNMITHLVQLGRIVEPESLEAYNYLADRKRTEDGGRKNREKEKE